MKVFKGEIKGISFNACYIDDPEEAATLLAKLTASDIPVWGLDIETFKRNEFKDHPKSGLCPLLSGIRLLQLYGGGDNIHVFDLFHVPLVHFSALFNTKKFIAHNANFEIKFLSYFGFKDLDISCSMIMDQLVYVAEHSPFELEFVEFDDDEEIPKGKRSYHSLATVTKRYLGFQPPKEEQLSDWGKKDLTPSQIIYAGLDALLTHKLGRILSGKLLHYKMGEVYGLLKKMQHVVADMELNGFPINWDEHSDLIIKWEEEYKKCNAACAPHFKDVNLRSSPQMCKWLIASFAHKPALLSEWPETDTSIERRAANPNLPKTYSFSKSKIFPYKAIPAIGSLLEFKKYAKLLDTFGAPLREFMHPSTKRIHPSFTLGKTVTGRMSCFNPNLQQVSADKKTMKYSLRNAFQVGKDESFVVADFGQIELRVQAEFSKDPVMLKVFSEGEDIYCAMASAYTGRTITKADKKERDFGKILMLALGYGMRWKKLRVYAAMGFDVNLTEEEAKAAYNSYHTTFKVYSNWCDRVREHCKKLGFARTALGKIRKLKEDEVYTKGPNHFVQGTAFEILGFACLEIREKFKSIPATLVNIVHDEVIAICKKGYEKQVQDIMQKAMENGMLKIFPHSALVGLAEPHFGDTWKIAKG